MAQQRLQGPAQAFQVFRLRQAVAAVLDQGDLHVAGLQPPGEAQARPPGHVRVLHAVDQADGDPERDLLAQQEVRAAVLQERPGDGVGVFAVVAGEPDEAVPLQRRLLFAGEPGPDQVLGEIGRGGGTEQSGHPVRPFQGRQQHDPAAHGGPHQHLGAVGQFIEHENRVLGPAADGAVGESAGGSPVTGVVETQEGLPARPAEALQRERLAAFHVGHQSGQEHDAGRLARGEVVGDSPAIIA